jgi:dihydrofolate reductase/thymidylate synthase
MLINKDMAATAIVAASATSRGIGWEGDLPWSLPGDLKHFAKVTKTHAEDKVNAVIMGKNTWNSIPPKFRPLKGRTNVVLSKSLKQEDLPEQVLVADSLESAWLLLAEQENLGHVYVIGGESVYQQAILEEYVDKIILTSVDTPHDMQFDTYFPSFGDDWQLSTESDPVEENGLTYKFQTYSKPNRQETQYLDLIQKILDEGVERGDRTGTGTKSLFGAQMRFDLRNHQLPLLTTKRTFWRGVAEELLWFISGSTNANLLQEKNIHIWDGNASKEFLENRGLGHREEGDLGPVYGFQWRHFGAKYQDMHTDYTGQGVDQLAECIDKIRNNPEDRRILMSAWNPAALDEMALPPCHLLCQFYVDTKKNEVSCHMYQRSADMGLGVPFNIASYALLTHLVAHVTGRKAGELVHTLGDAHVYLNHIEPLKEQLKRSPRAFPKIFINSEKTDIDDFTYDDLNVVGYNPMKAVSMKMAV